MPADSGKPDPAGESSDAASRRSRTCQVIFILGSGIDPAEQSAALAEEFRGEHAELDFSKAITIIQAADEWLPGDKVGFRASIATVVRNWCREQAASFDSKRLLVSDYQDDVGRQFAVAGYFPRKTSATAGQESDDDNIASKPSRFVVLAEQLVETVRRQPPKRLAIAGGSVALLLLLLIAVPMLLPSGGSDISQSDSDGVPAVTEGSGETTARVLTLPPPQFSTGIVRVYTPEPGFAVMVDGEPIRGADGEFVTTPCAVTTEQGARSVTVFREGAFDLSRVVDVSDESEVTLEPSSDAAGGGSDVLKAPYLNADIGKPIALTSLNSSHPETDPYVTPDRLSIWFVGDREDGRGLFVATRLSPFHDFDEPRLVSRSADLPATPSITDDSLYIVYAVPEKARLMALARANPLAGFDGKDALRYSSSLAPTWTSSQILGDGLRLYWVEETGDGEVRTLTSSRVRRTDVFGKTLKVQLAGTHPCMSRDGLRQYTFDGKTLTRYRRTSTTKAFIEDGVIAELDLAGYHHSQQHRQFFVSSDEQWLFYCDNPVTGGDLFMVRLSAGPKWGVAPRGKSIPPKRVVVVATTEPDPTEMIVPEKPKPKPVDPRTLPLPYTSHRKAFTTLLDARQYDEAAGLLRNAQANSELQKFTEQLAWDEEDLQTIRSFWSDLEKSAVDIKPGEAVRIGTLQLEVVGFENGVLVGKRGDTEIRKKLIEIPATELSGIFDAGVDKANEQAQYRYGVLLAYESKALERARVQRFERCADLAATFKGLLARRKLAQAIAELERANFGQGVGFLKETKALAAGTPVAAEAQKLEEDLYEYVKWRTVGPRKWKIEGNSYEADNERANGSLLVSEKEYRNFELSLEWKTLDTLTAQGGVFFHYPGRGELVDFAHKIHLSNDSGKGADQYSSGSLFGQDGPDENAVKPAGEWNTLEIKVVDKKVTVIINGKKVLETTATKETVPARGLICLDGFAGGITYRKILLSELPE
ncbi:MAG: DUF1080 domain-containing protein [Rhodopirellula sp.]|nr:DUF1080 domain-containing protein [Rhodopirellula sp.]